MSQNELKTLLGAAQINVADFQRALNLRGHYVHASTLEKYADGRKAPTPWMLATARHLATEIGVDLEGIVDPSILSRGDAFLRPVAVPPPEVPGKTRSVTCVLPSDVYAEIELLRSADPSCPSRSKVLVDLILAGLAQERPSRATTEAAARPKQYACSVCGKLSLGYIPKRGFDSADPAKRLPKKHQGKDGRPCPGNYRFAVPSVQ